MTKMLMINPEYVHFDENTPDTSPTLPVGVMHAGARLASRGITVDYQDNQCHPLSERDLGAFDTYGISTMGTQNIAISRKNYEALIQAEIDPAQIVLGGQGIDGLTAEEFQRIFPDAHQATTPQLMEQQLGKQSYWETSIRGELAKFSDEDKQRYFQNEVTVLLSQGCRYNCSFCGAKTGRKETFFDVEENLDAILTEAKKTGVTDLHGYVTSLDFFQGAASNVHPLKDALRTIIDVQKKYDIDLHLRALTRADTYMKGTEDTELMDLIKNAGFYRFGFGADGAANVKLLRGMRKGTVSLRSDLINAFTHAEQHGFEPEILYVFGTEEDTPETLAETRQLCEELQSTFPTSIYRGFPAKDNIPGNANWKRASWKNSAAYEKLLAHPEKFMNLGFETLANCISHEDETIRKAVNREAVKMSAFAHNLGRVQSYLTLPLMETDGRELMDEDTFVTFKEIAENYLPPSLLEKLTLENLPENRIEINRAIPKDV